MKEKPSSINADGVFEPFSVDDVPCEEYSHGVIVYTDSGRVAVRLTGEGYRKAATMEYWDGESP